MNLYKKCILKLCSFLVNNAAFAFNNPLCFRCCLFKENIKNNHDN